MASLVNSVFNQMGVNSDYLAAFGGIVAAYWGLKIILSLWDGIRAFVLAKSLGVSANLKKMGEWAVVTGATDGIGLAYAQQLADKGMNIVLISRNPEKLRKTASDIESKYRVQTKCISIDFTQNLEIYDKIRQQLTGFEVGVLVNNVGMSYDFPQFVLEVPDDKTIQNIIHVNCQSVTMMTRLVLPAMVERRRGVIINISSASGTKPLPLLTVYSATKAFVDFFSQAMDLEYRSKGVIIQSVYPYFVSTKMSRLRVNALVPDATSYVRAALATVGVKSRTPGCAAHALQDYVALRIPDWLYYKVTLPGMLGARSKALKKQANQSKAK